MHILFKLADDSTTAKEYTIDEVEEITGCCSEILLFEEVKKGRRLQKVFKLSVEYKCKCEKEIFFGYCYLK